MLLSGTSRVPYSSAAQDVQSRPVLSTLSIAQDAQAAQARLALRTLSIAQDVQAAQARLALSTLSTRLCDVIGGYKECGFGSLDG